MLRALMLRIVSDRGNKTECRTIVPIVLLGMRSVVGGMRGSSWEEAVGDNCSTDGKGGSSLGTTAFTDGMGGSSLGQLLYEACLGCWKIFGDHFAEEGEGFGHFVHSVHAVFDAHPAFVANAGEDGEDLVEVVEAFAVTPCLR